MLQQDISHPQDEQHCLATRVFSVSVVKCILSVIVVRHRGIRSSHLIDFQCFGQIFGTFTPDLVYPKTQVGQALLTDHIWAAWRGNWRLVAHSIDQQCLSKFFCTFISDLIETKVQSVQCLKSRNTSWSTTVVCSFTWLIFRASARCFPPVSAMRQVSSSRTCKV